MNAIEEELPDKASAPAKGPGERLQAARIKQGLTIEEVANRMHLSTSILEALEENNFEEITAPIFVKGYLRAYARIVSLDEEEMIGLYTEYHRDDDPPISTINNVGSELTVADARIRWTTYLVVLVLLTLLAAWWWNRQNSESTPISLDSQAEEETLADLAEPEPVIEAISESVEPSPRPIETPAGAVESAAVEPSDDPPVAVAEAPAGGQGDESMVERPAEASAATAAAEPLDGAAAVGETAAPADLALAAPATDQPAAAPAEPSGSAVPAEQSAAVASRLPAVIAPSGAERLTLVVHADTWADIKDGGGFRLVYDLLRAGSSVELTGEAPFAVFLGNGHGVELRYNDEAVDFSADIRDNNTARLSIGE